MACSMDIVKQSERTFGYHYLSHYFEYDPENGRVYHKEISKDSLPICSKFGLNHWNKKAGNVADSTTYKKGNTKYRLVCHTSVLGEARFLSHRLCWLLYHGEWPGGDIDHLDGDGLNNKISNLRDCRNGKANARNIRVNKERKHPRGVRFTVSGEAKTPTFKSWYRNENGKDVQLYCGRDYFEACCSRKSWENEMLKDPNNGYTARHFGRK